MLAGIYDCYKKPIRNKSETYRPGKALFLKNCFTRSGPPQLKKTQAKSPIHRTGTMYLKYLKIPPRPNKLKRLLNAPPIALNMFLKKEPILPKNPLDGAVFVHVLLSLCQEPSLMIHSTPPSLLHWKIKHKMDCCCHCVISMVYLILGN